MENPNDKIRKCEVCDGMGYMAFNDSENSIVRELCLACDGKGQINQE